ncbi:MAG: hypothetical protein AAF415_01195 [Pseudomonadota bacterium]
MRLLSLTILVTGLAIAGCSNFQPKVAGGVSIYNKIPHKGTMTSDWVDCRGGTDCSAQMRALNGGSRPHLTIYMDYKCHLTAARIDSPGKTYPLEVLRNYERPTLLKLEKKDVMRLAEGGKVVATFNGCGGDPANQQVRDIVFSQKQMLEIGDRLVDPFSEPL